MSSLPPRPAQATFYAATPPDDDTTIDEQDEKMTASMARHRRAAPRKATRTCLRRLSLSLLIARESLGRIALGHAIQLRHHQTFSAPSRSLQMLSSAAPDAIASVLHFARGSSHGCAARRAFNITLTNRLFAADGRDLSGAFRLYVDAALAAVAAAAARRMITMLSRCAMSRF